MECPECKITKLSNEFLLEPVVDDNENLCLLCLRCASASKTLTSFTTELASRLLDEKLNSFKWRISQQPTSSFGEEAGIVSVLSLEGDKYEIEFTNMMSVHELKKQVSK